MFNILFLIGRWVTPAHAYYPLREYCKVFYPTSACGGASTSGDPTLAEGYLSAMANEVIIAISDFLIAACVLIVIYGGIRIIASAGNDEGRTAGKNIVIAALVGLALALIGKAVVSFVIGVVSSLPGT